MHSPIITRVRVPTYYNTHGLYVYTGAAAGARPALRAALRPQDRALVLVHHEGQARRPAQLTEGV